MKFPSGSPIPLTPAVSGTPMSSMTLLGDFKDMESFAKVLD